jgi:hypothetical protein
VVRLALVRVLAVVWLVGVLAVVAPRLVRVLAVVVMRPVQVLAVLRVRPVLGVVLASVLGPVLVMLVRFMAVVRLIPASARTRRPRGPAAQVIPLMESTGLVTSRHLPVRT